MWAIKKKSAGWLAVGLCAAALVGILVYDGMFAQTQVTETRFAMGSPVTVTLTAKKKEAAQLASEAATAVEQLDRLISNKNATSSIGQLNASGFTDNADVAEYLRRCRLLSRQTEGAFDVTVGTLSRLWDFDKDKKEVPPQADITAALTTVGYQKVIMADEAGTMVDNMVTVPSGTLLDLGAAGKGMACGNAMDVLLSLGVTKGVVTVGGSVGVLGRMQTIGVRDPFGGSNTSFATLEYGNAVASTSGVYEKHFEQNGVNYHHILDPAMGYPVQNDLVSVTVVCPDGLASDALATACFKLGYEGSQKALDANNAMAVFVYKDKHVKTYNNRYMFTILDTSYEYETV